MWFKITTKKCMIWNNHKIKHKYILFLKKENNITKWDEHTSCEVSENILKTRSNKTLIINYKKRLKDKIKQNKSLNDQLKL